MFNVLDEISVDLATSCTKEVAVAKLLGWMRGPIRDKHIHITWAAIPDRLQSMPELQESLSVRLAEQRNAARNELLDAWECDENAEILEKKYEAVIACDTQIMKAASYMREIDDELAKKDSSKLQINEVDTAEGGAIHITLKSLDIWAREQFGIEIFNDKEYPDFTTWLKISTDQASAETSTERKNDGGMSRTKTGNFLVTFALLLEAFIRTAENKYLRSGSPNVSAIANHVRDMAVENYSADSLKNISIQSITDRIEASMKMKKDNLSPKSREPREH